MQLVLFFLGLLATFSHAGKPHIWWAQCHDIMPSEPCFTKDCFGKGRWDYSSHKKIKREISSSDYDYPLPDMEMADYPDMTLNLNQGPANIHFDGNSSQMTSPQWTESQPVFDRQCCRNSMVCWNRFEELEKRFPSHYLINFEKNPQEWREIWCCIHLLAWSCREPWEPGAGYMPAKFNKPPMCNNPGA